MVWLAKERTIRRYHEGRAELIALMGGACVECGRTTALEFHHLQRRLWRSSEISRWSRLARHKREWAAGQIALACGPCNRRIGQPALSVLPVEF